MVIVIYGYVYRQGRAPSFFVTGLLVRWHSFIISLLLPLHSQVSSSGFTVLNLRKRLFMSI